jgi:predicted PurR-regulated permease PerM
VWGIIIAITIYPLYKALSRKLRNHPKLSAVILSIILLIVTIIPSYFLLESLIGAVIDFREEVITGEIVVPAPTEKVRRIPLIGKSLYSSWNLAHKNIEAAITKYHDQLITAAKWFLDSIVGTGMGILQFALSIIISGILLVNSEKNSIIVDKLFYRLVGSRGQEFVNITGVTVKKVAAGILGVALIQSTLAGMGFIFSGIPYAGLWALIFLILAIIQFPPAIIIIPIAIYLYGHTGPVAATIWTIYFIIIGVSDNVLKPIMMGRGAPVPMLIIFLGSLGGFILSGFIGLFIGAIVLSLGYKVFILWVNEGTETP